MDSSEEDSAVVAGTVNTAAPAAAADPEAVSQQFSPGPSDDGNSSTATLAMDAMVYVVTGANCGLGFETARRLVRMPSSGSVRRDIVLACRDLTSAHEAMRKLAKFLDEDTTTLHAIQLELGNAISVRNFGNEMKKRFPKVDCLICNAGVLIPVPKAGSPSGRMAEDRQRLAEPASRGHQEAPPSGSADDVFDNMGMDPDRTPDGFEVNMGTNHIGHVFLVSVLMPLLRNSPSSRVVIVSSTLLKKAKLRMDLLKTSFKEMQDMSTMDAKAYYAESKLMNALFVRGMRRELDRRGIDNVNVYCVSPGWCKTQLHRNSDSVPFGCLPCFSLVAFCFLRSARKGSEGIFYCATEDASKLDKGCFYKNRKIDVGMEAFLDKNYGSEVVDDVLVKSQEATGLDLFH